MLLTFHIISSIKTIGIKTPALEASVNVQVQETREHNFGDKLDDLTDIIRVSLQSLSITPIYLLVDKVDEIWDLTPESKQLIVGLLRAMKEVLEQLGSVHVIVFLRSDIYESLEFHDSDKFHTMEEPVWWEKAELKEMLTLRAELSTSLLQKASAPQDDQRQPGKSMNMSIESAWYTFLPQHVEGEDSFEYLLRYSFMRPRDLIQLCNLCRDRAQNNRHPKIEVDDIDEALPNYSQWKLQDLRDEYSVQYPFLETLFLMVFYNTSPRLGRQTIQLAFEPLKAQLTRRYGEYYFDSLDKLLQILYNIGFLGATDKEVVRYSFRGEKVIIPYVSQFEIHPVFRWALATTSPTVDSSESFLPDTGATSPQNIEGGMLEDYTIIGDVRSISPTPMLKQPDAQGMNRLRNLIVEAYPHGELESLIASLNLRFDIMGRGSLSRQVQELISYSLRQNRYQDLVRQVLTDHPERAKDIL